jgi:hypothetical protein
MIGSFYFILCENVRQKASSLYSFEDGSGGQNIWNKN